MLVAEGRTNREVAAALFLTVHSVETTLTRVYRKLEVRSARRARAPACRKGLKYSMRTDHVTADHLVGREEELAAIVRLLDAPEELPSAVVLWGEAGIGKTSLWLAGVKAAPAYGCRILSARPAEAEARFSFAGLSDLLDDDADDVLPELPPIQRRALEAALLLGESEISAGDRAVAEAFLRALRLLAADRPVCVAIDDVQWLDAASLAALRYALARLDREPIAACWLSVARCQSGFAARSGRPAAIGRRRRPEPRCDPRAAAGATRYGVPAADVDQALGDLERQPLLCARARICTQEQRRHARARRGAPDPLRASTSSCRNASHGLGGGGARCHARPLRHSPIRRSDLVEAHVGELLQRSAGRGARREDSRARRRRGSDSPIRCSALRPPRARLPRDAGRSTHGWPEIVPSDEERARHLALATAKPDRSVAAILEEAARTAQARGAPAAAADLAEQALRLTPASGPDDARRRLFLAADMHNRAGDTARAAALLEQARATRPRGTSGQPFWHTWPASRQTRKTLSRSTARPSRRPKATMRSKPPSTSASPD